MPHPGHKPVKPLTPQEAYRQAYGKAFAKSFEETYRRLKAGSKSVAQPSPQPTGGVSTPRSWVSAQTKAMLAAKQQPSKASRFLKGVAKIAGRSRGLSPIGVFLSESGPGGAFDPFKKLPKPKSSTGSSTRTGAAEAKPKKKKPYTGGGRGGPKR